MGPARTHGKATGERALASLLAMLAALALHASAAQAQPVEKGAFGLGIILGEPTGIAGKLYLDDSTAVDGAVGLAVIGGGLHLHGDYLWHPAVLEERDQFVLPLYIGIGARLAQRDRGSSNDFHVGLRAVGGLLFDFKEIPIDVFVEVGGILDYVFSDVEENKGQGFDLNVGIGVRYYL